MTRMSFPLRLFWLLYAILALLVLALPAGSAIETRLAPIRNLDAKVENVGRSTSWLWFDWVSHKYRFAPSPGVDATMLAAGDVFDLTLYNDISEPGEARCTRVIPWARSRVVGIGDHRQPYCVEIPRTVKPTDAINLDVTAKYRGFGGLWTLYVPFPPISHSGIGAPAR